MISLKKTKSYASVSSLLQSKDLGLFGKFRVFRHEFTDYNSVQKANQDKYMDVANSLVDLTIRYAPQLEVQAEKWFKDKLINTLS
jgi:hypothetical protein